MFDLTKEINLDQKNLSTYKKIQIVLYVSALIVFIYLAYLVIFPHQYFSFSFSKPDSRANFKPDPYLENGTFPSKGNLDRDQSLFFNLSTSNVYSKIIFDLKLHRKSEDPESLSLSIRKSHRSFMYPEGDPIGFRNGSLLKNENDYFIVSDEKLRKFSSPSLALEMGYPQSGFRDVSKESLAYNEKDSDISQKDDYPNSTLFLIDEEYYILKNKELRKFISEQAFLTKYNSNQTIEKDLSFLEKYYLSEEGEGFADGTLVSNGIAAFVIENEKIFPIEDVKTFEEKDYSWEEVIRIGEDEASFYEEEKLFTINHPHPDGTIFKTIENSKYYLIKNKEKRLLPNEEIILSWGKNKPILVSEKSLETEIGCVLEKNKLRINSYTCKIPLEGLSELIGPSYEFKLKTQNQSRIDLLEIDYRKNVDEKNFRIFISETLKSIKENYATN
jgi:hypothetical protein